MEHLLSAAQIKPTETRAQGEGFEEGNVHDSKYLENSVSKCNFIHNTAAIL